MDKKILGIETSCDDTAVAIIDDQKNILANIVRSQFSEHQLYKGVVPEIAARNHLSHLQNIVEQALDHAQISLSDIDAIAATTGPGLIGGLIVGTMYGKTLSSVLHKPFIAINHLEAHALTARLTYDCSYPYLLLLISGGHCQFIAVSDFRKYRILGQTLDDAAGEAFDKVARLLDLPYPGGPEIDRLAVGGDELFYTLPKPLINNPGCDMSFSGLKTAVKQLITNTPEFNRIHLCASFQRTVSDILVQRSRNAMQMFADLCDSKRLVIAGGVAANSKIRASLMQLAMEQKFTCFIPPVSLCTDNAAMVAYAGLEAFKRGIHSPLTCKPLARWSLEDL